ncbi:MAG TPA: hypothetical protein VGM88_04205 [Kofleriaceae bacterium]|jgi:hypothetical protein
MKTVLAIALVLAAGACKKKEETPAAASGTPTAAAPAPAPGSPAAPAPAPGQPVVVDHAHRDRMERRDSMDKDPMPAAMVAMRTVVNDHAKTDPKTRQQAVCAVIADYKTQAAAVAAAPPPANTDASWGARTEDLTKSVGDLEKACTSGDAATFTPAFAHVHRAFHRLMSLNHRALRGAAGSDAAGSDEAAPTP